MINIIKGWVTSLIGLAIMIADIIHFFGIINFPIPEAINKPISVAIAFVVGLILFLVPSTKIENLLEKKASDLLDKTGK